MAGDGPPKGKQVTKAQTQLQELLAGAQKDLPATSTVDVDGQEMKQSDIVAKLQGWIQLYEQKDAAKATVSSTVQALQAAGIPQFRVSFAQALTQVFGKSSPLLGDFGLTITQRKTPSAQTPSSGASQEPGDAGRAQDDGVGAEEGRDGTRCEVSHRGPVRGTVGGVGRIAGQLG